MRTRFARFYINHLPLVDNEAWEYKSLRGSQRALSPTPKRRLFFQNVTNFSSGPGKHCFALSNKPTVMR